MADPSNESKKIFQSFDYDDTVSGAIQRHIDNAAKFASETNLAIVIFDNVKNSSVYLSPGYRNLFGENSDEVHPDDYEYIWNFVSISLRYLTVNKLNIADYLLICNYRARVKGEYLVVVSQASVVEVDSQGNPWLSMLIVNISPNQNFPGLVQFKLLNVLTGEIISPLLEEQVENVQILSSRELEILRLIEKGFISSKISELLNIRVNTVNTHRQHILKKLNARTSLEAVKNAVAKGIL